MNAIQCKMKKKTLFSAVLKLSSDKRKSGTDFVGFHLCTFHPSSGPRGLLDAVKTIRSIKIYAVLVIISDPSRALHMNCLPLQGLQVRKIRP